MVYVNCGQQVIVTQVDLFVNNIEQQDLVVSL